MTLIGIALIAGPMSKCAQFPLHLWLDEAMEGPLPSTILRNAVVVTTGIWGAGSAVSGAGPVFDRFLPLPLPLVPLPPSGPP